MLLWILVPYRHKCSKVSVYQQFLINQSNPIKSKSNRIEIKSQEILVKIMMQSQEIIIKQQEILEKSCRNHVEILARPAWLPPLGGSRAQRLSATSLWRHPSGVQPSGSVPLLFGIQYSTAQCTALTAQWQTPVEAPRNYGSPRTQDFLIIGIPISLGYHRILLDSDLDLILIWILI